MARRRKGRRIGNTVDRYVLKMRVSSFSFRGALGKNKNKGRVLCDTDVLGQKDSGAHFTRVEGEIGISPTDIKHVSGQARRK
jgi:hypothetical protein